MRTKFRNRKRPKTPSSTIPLKSLVHSDALNRSRVTTLKDAFSTSKFDWPTFDQLDLASEILERVVFICMTPRSGSTLLARAMQEAGMVRSDYSGELIRWNNPTIQGWITKHKCMRPLDFLEFRFRELEASSDTPLLIKCPLQDYLVLLTDRAIRSKVHKAKHIMLTRENMLDQAVSLFRADTTGLYHLDPRLGNKSSYQGKGDEPNKTDQLPDPGWSFTGVEKSIRRLCREIAGWGHCLACLDINPTPITFEDVVENRNPSLRRLSNELGLSLHQIPTEESIGVRKVSDQLNVNIKNRFVALARGQQEQKQDAHGSNPVTGNSEPGTELTRRD